MRRLKLIVLFAAFVFSSINCFAVTDKEMEQARTIATKWYLRYANDGSGYLDEINPKTMAELEKALKTKEQENIKAFKAIPNPAGYQSWDKQQLIDYWSVTAFKTKGLIEKGRQGGNRAKKYISNMTIAAPAAEKPKEEKKEETPKTENKPAEPVASQANEISSELPDSLAAAQDELKLAEAEILADSEELDAETSTKKAGNYTWVYIMVLAIIVGVVIALVVFASNVMKKNPGRGYGKGEGYNALDAKEIERYEDEITEKNRQIEVLSSKLEKANSQNQSLKTKLEALAAEVTTLRSRLSETATASAHINSEENRERTSDLSQPQKEIQPQPSQEQITQVQPQPQRKPLRTIYLGRANSKGIFVRADRNLNIGNSIYRLDTSDGFSGTFRVADDPTVWKMALLTPRESLAGACQAPDLENTDGMTEIVTDSAGTAVFEGGCWKVSRRAKIHYE